MSTITRDHLKTGSMLIIHLGMGLIVSVIGPSMVDLTELTGANMEELSRAIMFKSMGFLIGAPLGGYIAGRFRAQAGGIIPLVAFIYGLSCIMIPVFSNLIFMGFCFAFTGFGHSFLNVVVMSLIVVMWDEKSGLPLHALHMAWSIGAAVGPLYTAPFLAKHPAPPDDIFSDYLNSSRPVFENASAMADGQDSRITIPFGISGGVAILGGVVFLGLFIFAPGHNAERMHESRSLKNMLADCGCAQQSGCFAVILVIFVFFLYVCILGRDNLLNLYLAPIGVESSLNLPRQTAAYLPTVFTASGAVGHATRSILSHFFRIHIILFTDVILSLCCCVLLAIYGPKNIFSIFLLSSAAGFFGYPNYPSAVVWLNCYLDATGLIMAVIDMGIGVGLLIFTWLGGYIFEYYGPEYVPWLASLVGFILLLLLTSMQILLLIRGDRYGKNTSSKQPEDETTPLVKND